VWEVAGGHTAAESDHWTSAFHKSDGILLSICSNKKFLVLPGYCIRNYTTPQSGLKQVMKACMIYLNLPLQTSSSNQSTTIEPNLSVNQIARRLLHSATARKECLEGISHVLLSLISVSLRTPLHAHYPEQTTVSIQFEAF